MKVLEAPKKTCKGDGCCSKKTKSFHRLLVAVDHSDQAGAAVDVASRLAAQLQAEVVLVSVFCATETQTPEVGYTEPDSRASCVEEAEALLERTKASMPAGVEVTTVFKQGDPATEIVAAAVMHGVDLIIMGTHARGRLAQIVVGSTANAVIQKAPCPVIAVPNPRVCNAG